MGAVLFTFVGDEVGPIVTPPVGGYTVTRTTETGASDRLVMCGADLFKDRWKNEDGSPRTPSKVEVLEAMADSVVNGWKDTLLNWERDQAAQTARAAVQPITVT